MIRAIARVLRRVADRLEPPTPVTRRDPIINTSDSDERFVDDLVLRDALHRALNRYQPFRPPARA